MPSSPGRRQQSGGVGWVDDARPRSTSSSAQTHRLWSLARPPAAPTHGTTVTFAMWILNLRPANNLKPKTLTMLAVPGGGGGGGLGAERDRQVRLHSVTTDLALDLPPSIPLPDGEEIPYGSSTRLHIRDNDQESEIYQKCIRAPPNRTVFEGESLPPYRATTVPADWPHLHPHRYPPTQVPPVAVPRSRQRLSALTMVPCLTDTRKPGSSPPRDLL